MADNKSSYTVSLAFAGVITALSVAGWLKPKPKAVDVTPESIESSVEKTLIDKSFSTEELRKVIKGLAKDVALESPVDTNRIASKVSLPNISDEEFKIVTGKIAMIMTESYFVDMHQGLKERNNSNMYDLSIALGQQTVELLAQDLGDFAKSKGLLDANAKFTYSYDKEKGRLNTNVNFYNQTSREVLYQLTHRPSISAGQPSR